MIKKKIRNLNDSSTKYIEKKGKQKESVLYQNKNVGELLKVKRKVMFVLAVRIFKLGERY